MAFSSTLPIPTGSTVDVSIIDGGRITMPTAYVLSNQLPGHDVLEMPCYSFLIENKKSGKKVLFDLGLMKAWREKEPPAIHSQIESAQAKLEVQHDVSDQLRDAGIPLESINAIIWSHHHLDHTGDPSLFPSSTSLVLGPGFKKNNITFPGYPENPDSLIDGEAFKGRELIELDFSNSLNIGGFPAIDFFGDGSFYILQSEGHTHEHMSALARTSQDHYIFLAGDIAHYPGEYRPSQYLPLPTEISPSPLDHKLQPTSICPASVFEKIHPSAAIAGHCRTTPFYQLPEFGCVDLQKARNSLDNMEALDGSAKVFVIIAHDASLLDVVPFFPKKISDWNMQAYKRLGAWRFLKDLVKKVNRIQNDGV
ncbi:hypothetical protein UA08_06949 [Talaromyces atroroseus]|uniref:Metallo-beta-lactamase domain-containing protein n=1 Tax=Talaromyces atroroseus TaxID=1441469 RepID=A0A225AVT4_TALAT|nr:hypothetical protein UA08_06949 [Talaromyces atroroseus]OKL57597.1 hypothetical protein UA08_06949 [Talaromyces atroroseus]